MKSGHLSENEIQDYVVNVSLSSHDQKGHVEQCEVCRQRIQLYHAVFERIAEQGKPAFDFDLPDLVMTKLLPVKKHHIHLDLLTYTLGLISMSLAGLILYLFGKEMIGILRPLSYMGIYFVWAAFGTMFLFNAIDIYRKFEKNMKGIEPG